MLREILRGSYRKTIQVFWFSSTTQQLNLIGRLFKFDDDRAEMRDWFSFLWTTLTVPYLYVRESKRQRPVDWGQLLQHLDFWLNLKKKLQQHTQNWEDIQVCVVRVLLGVSELVPNESSPVSHIKASYFLSAEKIFTGLLWTSVSLGTNWFVLNARRRGCRGRVTVQDTPRTLQGHSRTTHYSLNQLCKIWHCIYCELYI